MRDHVVQLARDAAALVGERAYDVPLALGLEVSGELLESSCLESLAPDEAPDDRRCNHGGEGAEVLAEHGAVDRRAEHCEGDAGRDHLDHAPPLGDVHGQRVEDDEGDDVAHVDEAVAGDQPGRGRNERRDHRVGAPDEDRQRRAEGDEYGDGRCGDGAIAACRRAAVVSATVRTRSPRRSSHSLIGCLCIGPRVIRGSRLRISPWAESIPSAGR